MYHIDCARKRTSFIKALRFEFTSKDIYRKARLARVDRLAEYQLQKHYAKKEDKHGSH